MGSLPPLPSRGIVILRLANQKAFVPESFFATANFSIIHPTPWHFTESIGRIVIDAKIPAVSWHSVIRNPRFPIICPPVWHNVWLLEAPTRYISLSALSVRPAALWLTVRVKIIIRMSAISSLASIARNSKKVLDCFCLFCLFFSSPLSPCLIVGWVARVKEKGKRQFDVSFFADTFYLSRGSIVTFVLDICIWPSLTGNLSSYQNG